MTEKVITLKWEKDDPDGLGKETKNTVNYEAVQEGEPSPVKNLYVQKWLFEGEPPEEIELTLDY